MVGLAALLFKTDEEKENPEAQTKAMGIIMLIVAQFFSGGLFIVEEKLLGDYYLDPLKVVGLEGLWGCIIWAVLLPIFQQIKCDNEDLCPYGLLEDTKRAF